MSLSLTHEQTAALVSWIETIGERKCVLIGAAALGVMSRRADGSVVTFCPGGST